MTYIHIDWHYTYGHVLSFTEKNPVKGGVCSLVTAMVDIHANIANLYLNMSMIKRGQKEAA